MIEPCELIMSVMHLFYPTIKVAHTFASSLVSGPAHRRRHA